MKNRVPRAGGDGNTVAVALELRAVECDDVGGAAVESADDVVVGSINEDAVSPVAQVARAADVRADHVALDTVAGGAGAGDGDAVLAVAGNDVARRRGQ